MNKKLMAVAVAGALAAPAAVLAQTSTVQIYGYLNAEYGLANPAPTAAGTGRSNYDALNSGASRIGLRGEESLGGGLSAWWQCETDVRFLGGATTAPTWCDRNSALGLKGGFGSVYVGNWDSPIKRVSGITRMTNETGWMGTQQMTISNGGAWSGTFSNRNSNSINYDTPNFSGFSASGQYTTLGTANNDGLAPTKKGRVLGLSGQYVNGPLAVVAGYAKGDDDRGGPKGLTGGLNFAVTPGAAVGDTATAWLVGATYAFGPVKLGFSYANTEFKVAATGIKNERKGWNAAADWAVTSNGVVRLGYAKAGDKKISNGTGIDDGAKLMQISYNHSLSKRTTASIGYVRMSNDNSGTYNLTGVTSGAAVQAGSNSSAFVLGLIHTF